MVISVWGCTGAGSTAIECRMGAAGAGRTGTIVGAVEPFEKKFALALTTLLSFLTGCSTVSKLESGCSLRGDNVNPWY